MGLEEGDLVVCTVEKIEKTVVFVKVHVGKMEIDGSIITSEIAPGRIRNIRDYVFPKKRIVCKVLRITQSGNIELSFRRVSMKERKEMLEREKLEKGYISILRGILGQEFEGIVGKIREKWDIVEFVNAVRENPKILEDHAGKKNADKIIEILSAQKEKNAVLKREVMLRTNAPNGLETIKSILGSVTGAEVRYISAGKYMIRAESKSAKDSDRAIKEAGDTIERLAKSRQAEFSIIEK
jgi:translation initiation factor 2 alpha subunit (eIF-2alpha)